MCIWVQYKNNMILKSTFSSDIYHTTFDWPPNAEIQTRLEETPGYTEEDMVNKLIEYHRHIDEIEECYRKVIKKVNADQPKADVFSQGNYKKKLRRNFTQYFVRCTVYPVIFQMI